MADVISKKVRSVIMSKIRSKNTKIELLFKKFLSGLHFRHQPPNVYGKPDFAIKRIKIVVFIDSCFWHKCTFHFRAPNSNRNYWIPKIRRNVIRAAEVNNKLKKEGWIVFRFWEHQIRKNPEKGSDKVAIAVKQRNRLFTQTTNFIHKSH